MIDTAVILGVYGRTGRPETLSHVIPYHLKQNIAFLLVVAEVVFDDQDAIFEPVCSPYKYIKIEGRDENRHLFQKESLWNICIRSLPRHIKYVIVLDADFFSDNPNWFGSAVRKLIRNPHSVVQMYTRWDDTETPAMKGTSFAWAHMNGLPNYCSPTASLRRHKNVTMSNNPGGAWAFTKRTIEEFGLFNPWMVDGRGDTAFIKEMFFSGCSPFAGHTKSSPSFYGRYDDMHRKNIGNGLLDCINFHVYHKHHGDIGSRNYEARRHAVCLWNKPRKEIVGEGENGLMYWKDPECIERKVIANMMDYVPQCEKVEYVIKQYIDLGYNFY